MTEQRQFRAIKGTRDILPPDSALWNWFEATARRVMESYGFREIRLPIFEYTELFARSVGADTDIVSKEMYSFEERPTDEPPSFDDVQSVVNYLAELKQACDSGLIQVTETNAEYVKKFLSEFSKLAEEAKEFTAQDATAGDLRSVANKLVVAWQASFFIWTSLTLRPEATAGVVRAYIEHGMQVQPGLVKLYYIGPMFRRERPQKGRYRQFYQIGAEVLGQSDAPATDAELIEMLLHLFAEAGLEGCTLHINSIGCKECRPKYVAELRAALEKVRDKLGPDSQRRIETNPLRVLDSKLPDEQPIIETLPRIADHLCDACRAHYAAVKHDLTQNRGITFEENWRLVRGLDYYMRTTFEIIAPGLGSQNAVCGGGRYDGLIELLGGPPTKGIGFAIGTDRVILSLQETGKVKRDQLSLGVDVFIAWLGAAGSLAHTAAITLARKIRNAGFSAEVPPDETKLKKSLGLADKLGARYALIIGENEVASGRFALKHLADAQQRELTEGEIIEFLKGSREVRSDQTTNDKR